MVSWDHVEASSYYTQGYNADQGEGYIQFKAQ